MSQTIEKIWNQLENAYIPAPEQEEILTYAQSMDQRLSALKDLQQQDERIAKDTADLIFARYPKVEMRVDGRMKTERDLILILRYCGLAMLRNDLPFLENQLLHWLRTMLLPFRFGNHCLRDSYLWLDETCQKQLQPPSYALLKPFLQAVIQIVPEGENRE